jgi:hypothetical protein
MTPDPNPSRRYSDEEVRQLLKRASELESQGTTLPTRTSGPTLSDLEAIAVEAGINPLALRQAARELDSTPEINTVPSAASSRFLGGPLSVGLERVVEGEVPDSVLESLIPDLQRAADGLGQPSLLGHSLTWQSTDTQKVRTLQVTVSVGRGKTRLHLEERYGSLAGALFGGIMAGAGGGVGVGVGLGVGLGALGSALFATVFPLSVIGGSYALARTIYGSVVHRRAKVLGRLMEDLVATVEDGVESGRGRLGSGS